MFEKQSARTSQALRGVPSLLVVIPPRLWRRGWVLAYHTETGAQSIEWTLYLLICLLLPPEGGR